jgi:hypothetical protein
MAWGKKKNRELEYRKTGQAAALKPGDLGANEVYGEDNDDFQASWELESEPEPELSTLAD